MGHDHGDESAQNAEKAMAIDSALVRELAELLSDTGLTEIEVEDGKRKIHGSMGVSVGTGGYRSAYASALIPVGESTTIGVAVSKTDFGKHGGWYGDPTSGAYGHDYGYRYGPGFSRLRGGERQSIALSVMTGEATGSAGVPDGCAPGFRSGGRYVEPLWVETMRDGTHPCPQTAPPR